MRNAPIETKDVFVKAKNGDSEMQEIIDAAADKLGLGLSHIIQVIDPDVIVLGGSVTKDYKLFAAQLYSALNRYVQPIKGREFNIKISQFDGEQVILGAVLFGISCFSEDF